MPFVVVTGVVLGVLSRLEETEPFFLAISTHATWVLAPFLAAALTDRLASGVVLLTVANACLLRRDRRRRRPARRRRALVRRRPRGRARLRRARSLGAARRADRRARRR